MGSGKLSTVVRGKFIETVDGVLQTPTEALLNAHLNMTLADYVAFGKQFGFIRPGTEYHTDKEFFGDALPEAYFPPGGGVPDALGKVGVLVSGYIQALRVALYENPNPAPGDPPRLRNPVLPIVSYWVTEHPRFEVYATLSRSHREVHVLILTPEPSHHVKERPPQGYDENMWAVATEDRIKALHDVIPITYGPDNYFPIVGGAFAQKLKSY